jgi:hypothetical protein
MVLNISILSVESVKMPKGVKRMKFPDEKSTWKEIETFRPRTMFGSWYWFGRKPEIIAFKNSAIVRFKKSVKSFFHEDLGF